MKQLLSVQLLFDSLFDLLGELLVFGGEINPLAGLHEFLEHFLFGSKFDRASLEVLVVLESPDQPVEHILLVQ
jgi:hypothetical protein